MGGYTSPSRNASPLRLVIFVVVAILGSPSVAHAFCGFYVSGADTKLVAEATQVVLMREGTRTVIAMQNDYKGPPQGFAMVVPVPVVLQKENVKTLSREVFDRVDKLSAPRLVEYWEQDPCPRPVPPPSEGSVGLASIASRADGSGTGSAGPPAVKIEAQFAVGEYEIVILSAQDSGALDVWLKANGYKIPADAEPALRPYVQAGMKFFVAKVNVAKVRFDASGTATLSPLRFHYDSERFELPVKLGLLSSSGTQDLVVHVLSPGQRYQLANYPNVTIPTNLDVTDATRTSFGSFYAALFDRTLEKTPGGIVTEYAWGASSCDPCPAQVQGLTQGDLATLGADVLPSAKPASSSSGRGIVRIEPTAVMGKLAQDVVQPVVLHATPRFRACYERGLAEVPDAQGKVVLRFEIDGRGAVGSIVDNGSDIKSQGIIQCAIATVRRMSFPPPESGNAVATVTLRMTTGPASPAAPAVGLGSIASNFVLTRLHARYSKDTLGNDLVFKAAPPIVGGREAIGPSGKLEQGVTASSTNAFQARYAIRHAWQGPMTCASPRRGVWGGPWPGNAGSSVPVAATRTAYAPRGKTSLSAFVPAGIPDVELLPDPAASASPASSLSAATSVGDAAVPATAQIATVASDAGVGEADASAAGPPPVMPSRCGCEVVGASSGDPSSLLGVCGLFGLAAVALARRRGHAACDPCVHGKHDQPQ
ncbi:MAG: DUF2330 domain-containing protein [Deltaproteobacteria bacterium]|nr:DUF2330 domain-containing protein [Deltaproteobacteria bacterium]